MTACDRVMVDIETLGLDRHAAIISLGAVRFDAGKMGETFYREVNLESNDAHGRTIDEDTWDWWTDEQGADEATLRAGADLVDVLADFAEWYGDADEIWANSPSFDCELLEDAYAQTPYSEPWEFWEERDYRTLSELPVAPDLEMQGEEHHALDDAKHQAHVAATTLKRLNSVAQEAVSDD